MRDAGRDGGEQANDATQQRSSKKDAIDNRSGESRTWKRNRMEVSEGFRKALSVAVAGSQCGIE